MRFFLLRGRNPSSRHLRRSGADLSRSRGCVTLHAVGFWKDPHHNASCTRLGPGETRPTRSEEHTSELQSLMRISYAVFCLKKKTHTNYETQPIQNNTTTKSTT